jgi:hypothetical protein
MIPRMNVGIAIARPTNVNTSESFRLGPGFGAVDATGAPYGAVTHPFSAICSPGVRIERTTGRICGR